ncbi:MAG: RNA 2',3'-cyclic phosphodiesterase [Verrucomicrobia bacterium]|nr:RNA 2',3'-cyclic phosphodiesterase [Deltaproteobacteria bacterium]
MRLFIAIELPDNLKMALGRLRIDIPGARWVPAEQIHLTLAFLGEVEEASVELLTKELAQIHAPGFDLCFSGTGCFPNRSRPRVLWIGLESEPHLQALVSKVREAVLASEIPQEERPFSPHITLARIRLSPSREFDTFLEQNKKLKLLPFLVREFTLFQSRLTPRGAVHIPLRNFSLASAGVSSER